MAFTVALVGRPNVGKSTLFNRLIGRRLALVDDTPGVTRDRREGEARLGSLTFRVIDTAGLEDVADESLEARMRRQTERAIADADVALLMVDARSGLTEADRHFARLLRRGKTPVLLVANKCEGRAGRPGINESFELGLGDPVALSAEHGEGLADLFEALLPYAEKAGAVMPSEAEEEAAAGAEEAEAGAEERPRGPLELAIVGRPNVGKSTLINRLIGEDRLLTGPEAGITRDSIAVPFRYQDREIRLIDTAGMRRRPKVQSKLEKLSVGDTLRSIRFAELVILVIDATVGLDKQDMAIGSMVVEEGRALVVALNKWDAVKDRDAAVKAVRERLGVSLAQVRGVKLVPISGQEGRGLDRLMKAGFQAYEVWNRRIPTSQLNRWLGEALGAHAPPLVQGRNVAIRYMTQVKARPPTFALFSSRPEELPDSYLRYLTNGLRDTFDLDGVPIRMLLRKGKNPYAGKSS
jgi:GTP-binding protein